MTTDRTGDNPTYTIRPRVAAILSALVGLLAAAVALGVAQLVAVLTGPESAPINAVGQGVIRMTPEWAKEFAIRTFGESDKLALLIGTSLLILVFALLIGLITIWWPTVGAIGIALFGVVGVLAALTAPTGSVLAVVPSVLGAAAGIAALLWMAKTIRRRPKTAASEKPEEGRDLTAEQTMMRDRKYELNRRGFMGAAGASLGLAVVGGGAGQFLVGQRFNVSEARAAIKLPKPASPAPPLPAGVDLKIPGLTPFTTTNDSFYRVDTALVLPQIDPDEWRLRIHGMVEREMTITFAQLKKRALIERDITFTCVSNEVGGNLAGQARWLGAPLADILREAGVKAGADQIYTTSDDGWTCGTPTKAVLNTPNAMLAIGMNGEPLPVKHGFPVRMIVPGLYGYVSGTKWIVDMELTTFADGPQPYWVQRKWTDRAPIKTMSRIDTPGALGDVEAGKPVKVAGMAWAQTRGIKKVEVSVENGPWTQTDLAPAANNQTWRQWTWTWTPSGTGNQSLAVRATDGNGVVQTNQRAEPFPNGASGWHTVSVNVT